MIGAAVKKESGSVVLLIFLIVLLALLAIVALLVWWIFDIDLADLAASTVTPIIGIGLIYWHGGPWALAGGFVLLAIGAFSLYFLLRRPKRRPPN